jgi:protein-S-isoprenylcysteine O-methyltransferase Ste14
MAGFVPRSATIFRIIIMAASLGFSFYLTIYEAPNPGIAIIYFLIAEILYLGFISSVLPENGLRHWFMRKWGDEKRGYRTYETILGFLFFHNGASIGYISTSSPGTLFNIDDRGVIFLVLPLLIAFGFVIKIWAAKVVSVDIYYWKDMFLGRKICEFVVTGPYKYFSNPMYGIGQLPAYATAIWYGSIDGLMAAIVNQLLIFTFYFLAEKKFIKRIYLTEEK